MPRPSFCRSESSKTVKRYTQEHPSCSTHAAFPPTISARSADTEDPVWLVSLRSVRLDLGLSVLFVAGLLGQARGHGGCLHHCFEAALSLLDVLLRVEDDDIDLGYVEHAQGHGGAQAHGHGQGRGLDEHLEQKCHISGEPLSHGEQMADFRFNILTQCSFYKFNLGISLLMNV